MLPAGVHIGTQAFAVAGTNEWFLTWIKDAECDPVVEIMSRVFTRGTRLVVSSISNLGHSELGWPFSFPVAGRVSESSGLRLCHDLALRCAEARMMSLRSNARLALRKGRSNQHRVENMPSSLPAALVRRGIRAAPVLIRCCLWRIGWHIGDLTFPSQPVMISNPFFGFRSGIELAEIVSEIVWPRQLDAPIARLRNRP